MRPADYIGIPWAAGAQGPAAYDCMGFFRHIQQTYFGIAVPTIIADDYENPLALAALFGDHSERSNWSGIVKPVHGCAVISRKPMHIGVWLNIDGGGVLHCVRGPGVIFTSDSAWPVSGFGRKSFFQHNP